MAQTTFSPAVAELIRDYAPAAAAALGTAVFPGLGTAAGALVGKLAAEALAPAAETAVQEIGKRLDVSKPTIERINSVVLETLDAKPGAQSMDDLKADLGDADEEIRLRLAEMAHAETLQRLSNENTADARKREISMGGSDWFQRFVGASAMVLAAFVFAAILLGYADTKDAQTNLILGTVLGLVGAWAGNVVNYYFGSSSGSAAKANAIESRLMSDR